MIAAQAVYPIDFTQPNKRFVLNLHSNGSNNFLFVHATKIYQTKYMKQNIYETKNYALSLGNISKAFTIHNMKKTGFKGVAIFFSVDFNPIDTSDILDIHKYLKKYLLVS